MAVEVRFDEDAREEFQKAIAWYEQASVGKGQVFLLAVREVVRRIADSPNAGHPYEGLRRWLVPRFPYAIVYQTDPIITVVAVADHRDDSASPPNRSLAVVGSGSLTPAPRTERG